MNFWEIMDKGGVLMYPILFCTVISLTILFERMWIFAKRLNKKEIDFILQTAKTSNLSDLKDFLNSKDNFLAEILFNVIANSGDASFEKTAEIYAKQSTEEIYKFTSIPGLMATVSPLLGLLGTVLGMIKVFALFTSSGGNPMVLAGGIWEALITTAAGLTVAIPSLFIYRYLIFKADKTASILEFSLEKVLNIIENKYQNNKTTFNRGVK